MEMCSLNYPLDRPDLKCRKERPAEMSRCFCRNKYLLLLLLLTSVLVASVQLCGGMMQLRRLSLDSFRLQSTPELSHASKSVSSRAKKWHSHLSWQKALHVVRSSRRKYVIADVRNGLGNRLRAMASARAVADSLQRPMLLIWLPDLHCNCSFRRMFQPSDPSMTLIDEEIPQVNLSSTEFQKYNYMRPEPGAIKDEYVRINPRLHLYFKSAFIMNHAKGKWRNAQRFVKKLVPVPEVARRLVADKKMIGLHIRNVFDAPRDEVTSKNTVGNEAILGAKAEYGAEGANQLLTWRKASHWTNFVPQIQSLMREHGYRHPEPINTPLQFYLAADTADAYTGLGRRFPSRIISTHRNCGDKRCDFRDCRGMIYSLIDLMNLARTRLILGSGWSSYSEVASYMGGDVDGEPLPILMAGRDFGQIVHRKDQSEAWRGNDAYEMHSALSLQQYWPKPFAWDAAALPDPLKKAMDAPR